MTWPHPPTHLWHKFAKHVEKDENGGNDTQGDSRTVVEQDVSVAGGGGGEGRRRLNRGGGGEGACEKMSGRECVY